MQVPNNKYFSCYSCYVVIMLADVYIWICCKLVHLRH